MNASSEIVSIVMEDLLSSESTLLPCARQQSKANGESSRNNVDNHTRTGIDVEHLSHDSTCFVAR
jgi:hypothetical protein